MTKLWPILALIAPTLLNGITLYRTYGGAGSDEGYDLLQTDDHGYLIVGYTTVGDHPHSHRDMYVVRTDSLGDTLWTRCFGDTLEDVARSVVQAHTGGYVIAGHAESRMPWGKRVFLIKIGDDGSEVWRSYYGKQNADEEAFCIKRTQDGGYVVAGRTTPHGSEFSDIYLLKVDGMSNPLGTRIYGGTNTDDAYSITQTQDGGFALTGVSHSLDGWPRIYVMKTGSSFDSLWMEYYNAGIIAEGWDILETPERELVVAGWRSSEANDAYLMRLRPDGDTAWTRAYTGLEGTYAHSLQQLSDGGYVIGGAVLTSKSPQKDVGPLSYLVRTDQHGSILWTRALGTLGCLAYSVCETSDGGYALAGQEGLVTFDVLLIQTDSSGVMNSTVLIPNRSEQDSYDADTVSHSLTAISNNVGYDTVLMFLSDVDTALGWSASFSDTLLFLDPLGGRSNITVTIVPPSYSKSDTIEYATDTCYLNAYSYAADTTFVAQVITHAYHIGVQEINKQLSIGNCQLAIHPNPFVHSAEVGAQGIVPFAKGSVETPYMVSLQVHDLSGRLVRQLAIDDSRSTIIGKNLSPGIYFVRVVESRESGTNHNPTKIVKLR